MRQQTGAPLTIFYSYAHEDDVFREQLEKHLSLLKREGFISEWHDHQIVAGTEWAKEIDAHLEAASVILLLISPDFLASDYCYSVEMQRALERHNRGEACVIPVFLRPVDWESAPFARLQGLPRNGKSVTEWDNQDAAFRDVVQGIRRAIAQQAPPALPSVARQNRLRLLKQVRQMWIEGVLEQSLHQAALITLDLQGQPDALTNPWHLEVQETNRAPYPLSAGTSIVQIYDDADGELLILGEPGAGKTTLLLELTRTLLERVEEEERARLPVVFNLSSWAQGRPPLVKWLVEELWTKYRVPRTLGTAWMTTAQILPLLDGLDEVAEKARSACVQAINTYHQEHLEKGLPPLVVCCRSREYLALPTRVNLQRAVSIQPLTDEQIESYFQNAKGQLQELWHALHQDPEMYELVRSPLMLSIFTLAYQGTTHVDLPTGGTPEGLQRQVFASYVKRMLERRGVSKRFFPEQIRRWLTFVAAEMQQQQQTVFYLERLQPDWLATNWRQRLCFCLPVGVVYGLFFWVVFAPDYTVAQSLTKGLLIGLSMCILNLVLFVLLNGLLYPFLEQHLVHRLWHPLALVLQHRIIYGLINGVASGGILWLIDSKISFISSGLYVAVGYILIGKMSFHIQPVEEVTWSWRDVRSQLGTMTFFGLGGGLAYTFLYLLILGLLLHQHVSVGATLFFGLTIGTSIALSVSMGHGLKHRPLIEPKRLEPNQGIHASFRNGLKLGWRSGAILCPFIVLLSILEIHFAGASSRLGGTIGYVWALVIAVIFIVWSTNGGMSWLSHYVLRLMLWRMGCLPCNLVAFLDEAVERLLLRKVGGGYIFMHRLLLDYFADLEKKDV